MSSPKAARKPTPRSGRAKPARKVAAESPRSSRQRRQRPTTTAQARSSPHDIERGLADGRIDALAPEALQDLMAALCKTYSAQIEAGSEILPLRGRTSVTSTDIMTTASGLLKAANLAVFELGMWQSWTGR